MPEVTFQASILKELNVLAEKLDKLNPDTKSNTGRAIARAYMWDRMVDYAEKQSNAEWKKLQDDEIIDDHTKLDEGDHILGESPHFSVQCKVSAKRNMFDVEKLAKELKKKYRVPEPITKDMVSKAKTPGSSNRTLKILER